MSKEGKGLITQMAKVGAPLDKEGALAKFNFTISPISSFDADVELISACSRKIKQASRALTFSRSFDLAYLLIFPVVLNPAISRVPDSKRFIRNEKAYKVKRNIDFSLWKSASSDARHEILVRFMHEVIGDIPSKYISDEDRNILHRMIENSI